MKGKQAASKSVDEEVLFYHLDSSGRDCLVDLRDLSAAYAERVNNASTSPKKVTKPTLDTR